MVVKDDKDAEAPATNEAPGRVEFDSRGKAIWRWARDVLDSTSILLKRLENKDLALEPTRKVPVMSSAQGKAAGKSEVRGQTRVELSISGPASRESGSGFDPYNSGN